MPILLSSQPGTEPAAAPEASVQPGALTPRPDQQAAHDAVLDALAAGERRPVLRSYQRDDIHRIGAAHQHHRRVCYVAPTGSGKTVTFASIVATETARGGHTVIVGHRQEITDQISLALADLGVPHGMIRPDAPMTDHPVQVGMVQTLARRIERVPEPALLVVDEAHHAVAATWMRVFEMWPNARVLGCTATPERLDGRGLSDVFDIMIEGPDTATLIAQGWLAPIRYFAPPSHLDLSGVRMLAGDYNTGDLADVVDRHVITGRVIEHFERHLAGRTAIAFCVNVAHAEHVAQQFRDAGIAAESIDGTMTPGERRDVVGRLRTGDIRVLTSCEVISEGFDAPAVGGSILLRPTASLALARQQIGRCLRPKPDGSVAIILDHVGNVLRHGLPTDPHPWSLFSTRRTAADRAIAAAAAQRLRRCKACDELFAPTVRLEACEDVAGCLFAPPPFVVRPEELAEVQPASLQGGRWARVHGMSARIHHKLGSQPCLRIAYATDAGWVSEFLAVEHQSRGARFYARRRWGELSCRPHLAPPSSATEALARFERGELRRPARLLVQREGEWLRIRQTQFAAEAAA
jgi:superfamily II DNA or RNA helicase